MNETIIITEAVRQSSLNPNLIILFAGIIITFGLIGLFTFNKSPNKFTLYWFFSSLISALLLLAFIYIPDVAIWASNLFN